MNKPLCNNLQNVDRNKTVKCGLSVAEGQKKQRNWENGRSRYVL